jgi:hypothetical protein
MTEALSGFQLLRSETGQVAPAKVQPITLLNSQIQQCGTGKSNNNFKIKL